MFMNFGTNCPKMTEVLDWAVTPGIEYVHVFCEGNEENSVRFQYYDGAEKPWSISQFNNENLFGLPEEYNDRELFEAICEDDPVFYDLQEGEYITVRIRTKADQEVIDKENEAAWAWEEAHNPWSLADFMEPEMMTDDEFEATYGYSR